MLLSKHLPEVIILFTLLITGAAYADSNMDKDMDKTLAPLVNPAPFQTILEEVFGKSFRLAGQIKIDSKFYNNAPDFIQQGRAGVKTHLQNIKKQIESDFPKLQATGIRLDEFNESVENPRTFFADTPYAQTNGFYNQTSWKQLVKEKTQPVILTFFYEYHFLPKYLDTPRLTVRIAVKELPDEKIIQNLEKELRKTIDSSGQYLK